MIAEKNSVVSIVYELRSGSNEGDIVEALTPETPLTFLFGTGGLLPKFEDKLSGLTIGDSFDFLLNSEDAYGPVVESAVVHVPKNIFEVEGKVDENLLKVGNMIPMMDAEGRRLNGKILTVEEEAVQMDFNHPMAGNDLHFKGEVTEVRTASEEELKNGHIHGNGEACGCGSEAGSCDDKESCDDGRQDSCGCGC
ncbi:MAG: peptidylprolyl isomerase [Bacteroidetes bacterium]|nr:peptidylprolyl isomerase [Bacteroidota bacterium]